MDGAASVLGEAERAELLAALPAFLYAQRWFRGKARAIGALELADVVPVPEAAAGAGAPPMGIAILRVVYTTGAEERYVLPVARAAAGAAGGKVILTGEAGVLRAAHGEPGLARALLAAMHAGARWPAERGTVTAAGTAAFRGAPIDGLMGRPLGAEQSNTSLVYGDRYVLKVYATLEDGANPDLEIGRFLSERLTPPFPYVPAVAGWLTYRSAEGHDATLGLMQGFVPGAQDAWVHALLQVGATFDRLRGAAPPATPQARPPLELAAAPPADAAHLLGDYAATAALLGERVAALHLALASPQAAADPAFAPEPCDDAYRAATAARMAALAARNLGLLGERLDHVPPALRAQAGRLVAAGDRLRGRFAALGDSGAGGGGARTRVHGDLHLGQILRAHGDLVFLDFEGEPARSLAERRAKDLPLRDVAGMLRSFHYAALAPLLGRPADDPEAAASLPWAQRWQQAAQATFLAAYLEAAGGAPFLPGDRAELGRWLEALVLEKALYELGYELNNRPGWLRIPLDALEASLGA